MPNQRTEIRLRIAGERLAAGDVHAACGLCQLILVTDPDHHPALCLMGEVGLRIGAVGAARAFLDRARDLGNRRADELLQASQDLTPKAPRESTAASPRFLVIKSWGYGFWAEVCHVLGGLLLAEITGRAPVVHLGDVSRFGGSAAQDAFTQYFAPVGPWTLADVANCDPGARFPARWRNKDIWSEIRIAVSAEAVNVLAFLSAQEPVAVIDVFVGIPAIVSWIPPGHRLFGQSTEDVFRDLLARYLHPTAEMTAIVDRYFELHLRQTPFVAVHLRGHDKQGEVDVHGHLNELIMGLAAEVPGDRRLLLLTDNTRWLERFCAQFGTRVIVPEAARDDGTAALHFCLTGEGNPRLNGVEVLRDVLLATRAESFIGSGVSNVSAMVALLRRWPPGTCTLVSPPYIMQPMPYFYLDPEFHGDHARLNADEFVELSDAPGDQGSDCSVDTKLRYSQ